ncbi:UNVERIFIED_CONTAM: hypothetical protein NY603_31120, partial [Bacteroidetes bacterium 56_B9]
FLLKCAPTISSIQRSQLSTKTNHRTNSELFALSRQTSYIPPQSLARVLDLVISGLGAEAEIVHQEDQEEQDEGAEPAQHKQILEI